MSGRGYADILRNAPVVPGRANRKRLWCNTVKYLATDGTTRYRLHDTDIVTVSADGRDVSIYIGDWNTVTTRDRLNRILKLIGVPARVWSECGARLMGFGRHNGAGNLSFIDSLTLRAGVPVVDKADVGVVESTRATYLKERAAKARASAQEARARKLRKLAAQWPEGFYATHKAALTSALAATRRRKPRNPGVSP